MCWAVADLLAASIMLADPGRMVRLARTWPNAEALLGSPVEKVSEVLGVPPAAAAGLMRSVSADGPRLVAKMREQGIQLVTPRSEGYPPLLAHTTHAPPLLYAMGDTSGLKRRAVGVVGSRKATPYGTAVAKATAQVAAAAGLTVVSGGALGIDAAAHAGALAAGATAAVLGCGVDIAYPARHRGLFEKIRISGCIVSEYPPGTEARPYHFPIRNRLMAGMCERIVIVEAARRSGALITAGFAADCGRDVMAVPASIWAPQSAGCLALLADGAAPLTDPADVLGLAEDEEVGRQRTQAAVAALSDDEREVLRAIQDGAESLQEVAELTGLRYPACLAAVSVLEVQGVARNVGGGMVAPVGGLPGGS